MSTKRVSGIRRGLGFMLIAAFTLGVTSTQAGEELFTNSGFDANADGWSWENWSAAGSSVGFDAAKNSVVTGGAPTSGSMKIVNNFTSVSGYQQAVYTVQLPAAQNFQGAIGFISFDVKVDESSTARAAGDYGFLEVVLRQGNNWDWVTLPGTRLNGTGWQRVNFQVPKAGVDSIRAITVKLGENDFLGPVTLNVDNVSYSTTPDDVAVTGADNGTVGATPGDWTWENWSGAGAITFDGPDTRGRSTSGTYKLDHQFANNPGGYQQTVFTYALPGGQVNAAQEYSTINLDVKVDPTSVPRAGGDYGYFEVILRNGSGWDWVSTSTNGASGVRFTDTNWHHLSLKVNALADAVHHLTFKVGENALLGPVRLNIDNVTFTRNTAPPAPPKLTLTPSQSGLTLVTTSTDAYGRHNIYTTDNFDDPGFYGFLGSASPVSYSFTLNSFPDATAYAGFQAHIFLVPGSPGTEFSPDWNEPTLAFMDIKAGAGGTGNATFRIKTDLAGNNTELYGLGDPHTVVNSSNILGNWTLTAQGTVFTMTAPDGTVSAPIDIGTEAAAFFGDGASSPLRVYFGVQPNGDANKGQSVRVGGVQIKRGATVLVSDNFTGTELDLNKWTPNATTGGVSFVSPADAGYVLKWTLPDSGLLPQVATSLSTTNWTSLAVTPTTVGQTKQAVLPKSLLPAGNAAYFRLAPATPAAQ